jgi:hypothetical protein
VFILDVLFLPISFLSWQLPSNKLSRLKLSASTCGIKKLQLKKQSFSKEIQIKKIISTSLDDRENFTLTVIKKD